MTIDELITAAEKRLQSALTERTTCQESLVDLRSRVEEGYEPGDGEVAAAIAKRDAADTRVDELTAEVEKLRGEKARDEQIAKMQAQVEDTGVSRRAYDQVTRVGQETRTYHEGNDPTGRYFLQDVLRSSLFADIDSQQRLGRHMAEERVERGGDPMQQRTLAPLTTNFSGLVVPQYLIDLAAPYAKAARPLADAVRKHPLPASGMTVNISRATTATTAAVQTQGDAVSETAFDDTILTINVQTIAGSQTVSRQAAERGEGVLDVLFQDLLSSYNTALDNELLNQGTNGLATVGNAVTFTDNTSPTAVECYGFIANAAANVEAALKNQDPGSTIIVMHPRRWWWFSAATSTASPVLAQNGVPAGVNTLGVDYATRYGSGYRGVINGLPVIADANIVTNLGAATNQDEIYVLSANESHLWEDPNAPVFIRTDVGPNMKALGVDMVLFGYSAFTHIRYAHAQRISGTGLVTPTYATIS
jgi:hypothetical protein